MNDSMMNEIQKDIEEPKSIVEIYSLVKSLSDKIESLYAANDELYKNRRNGLSFIDSKEEEEARALIAEQLGFKPPRPAHWNILVKIHYKDEDLTVANDKYGKPILGLNGQPLLTVREESRRITERWSNLTALVLAVGPSAYQGDLFKDSGPSCKVGDYVLIPRSEGANFSYKTVAMQILPDDKVFAVIDNPEDVTRK